MWIAFILFVAGSEEKNDFSMICCLNLVSTMYGSMLQLIQSGQIWQIPSLLLLI